MPSCPGVAHHRFVATIGGGASVAKVQLSVIAEVGLSTSTPFPQIELPRFPSPKGIVHDSTWPKVNGILADLVSCVRVIY